MHLLDLQEAASDARPERGLGHVLEDELGFEDPAEVAGLLRQRDRTSPLATSAPLSVQNPTDLPDTPICHVAGRASEPDRAAPARRLKRQAQPQGRAAPGRGRVRP